MTRTRRRSASPRTPGAKFDDFGGYCVRHPDVRLRERVFDGWHTLHERCPACPSPGGRGGDGVRARTTASSRESAFAGALLRPRLPRDDERPPPPPPPLPPIAIGRRPPPEGAGLPPDEGRPSDGVVDRPREDGGRRRRPPDASFVGGENERIGEGGLPPAPPPPRGFPPPRSPGIGRRRRGGGGPAAR